MKILFTIADANLRGGTEILAFHLLHELNACGVECRLLSVVPYHGEEPMVVSFAKSDYEEWARLLANPLNKLKGNNRSDAFLRQLISMKAEELGAEWIINHTYDMCAAIPTDGRWKTAQVFNWSIRGYESSLENIIRKKGFVGRVLSMMGLNAQRSRWHKALPAFTRLVMLTDAAHAEAKEVCPSVVDEQLVTIPDPLMQTEDSKVLTSLQNKNVVFVGRLSHEKGVMRLLRIWEHVSKHLSGYTLSIYGNGDCLAEMRSWLEANGMEYMVEASPNVNVHKFSANFSVNTSFESGHELSGITTNCSINDSFVDTHPHQADTTDGKNIINENFVAIRGNLCSKEKNMVEFKGFCNDLAEIYTNADLLLMTSDSEGFGMVLIEAMYYGVPCITFDCPVSPKEIIADAGIAVPCFDEEQYADEVIKLLCEPERMKALQQKATERAGEYYINKVVGLWKQMIA